MAPNKNNKRTGQNKNAIAKPPEKRRKIEKPKLKTPVVIKYKLPPIPKTSPAAPTNDIQNESRKVKNVITKKEKLNISNDHLEMSQSSEIQDNKEEKKPRKKNNKLNSACNVVNQNKGNMYAQRKITLKNTNNVEKTPKLTKKAKRKLDELNLANEVAMAQFPKNKKCKISEESPIVISITNTSFVDNNQSPEKIEDDPVRTVNNNSFKKRGRPKKVENNIQQTTKVTRKRKADSTITKPELPPKLELITRTFRNTLCNGGKNLVKVKGKDSTPASDVNAEEITSTSTFNQISLDIEDQNVENKKTVKSPKKRNQDTSTVITSPDGKVNKDVTNNKLLKRLEYDSLSQIDSRRSSNSCVSDYLSWTKDISSSSTTTCITVNSDDVVRIDGKLPVVRLHNKVSKRLKTHTHTLLSSESTTDKKETAKELNSLPETLVSNVLNLSTASSPDSESDEDNQQNHTSNDDNNNIQAALSKMSLNMKLFDSEFINWTQYNKADSNNAITDYESDILKIMTEEHNLIVICKNMKCELSGISDNHNNFEYYSILPNDLDQCSNPIEIKESNINLNDIGSRSSTIINKQEKEMNNKYKPFCLTDQNDDDDALSLFAESISGIESSKDRFANESVVNNDTSVPDFEEYIPQPVSNIQKPAEINYYPTKILEKHGEGNENSTTKTVCEKQNADSTSIYRVPEEQEHIVDNTKYLEYDPVKKSNAPNFNTLKFNNMNTTSFCYNNQPMSIKDFPHKRITGTMSYIFRGVCFFNLISTCKRGNCGFPHKDLDITEVEYKLKPLPETAFIQEYILLLNWPGLRRKYSVCFVNEAVRRDLPRIVVEMGIDSIIKANLYSKEDKFLKVKIIEIILSYLNNIDLEICRDLLMNKVGPGVLLCDEFMETLAETQNFSRFKLIFINLVNFIVKNSRTFNLNVASHILERVPILPFDKSLYHALISIIHNTNTEIFENPMMQHLKKRLASLDTSLLQELVLNNKQDIPCEIPHPGNNFNTPSQINKEQNRHQNHLMQTEREKRYTSPDTTNVDNMMKGVTEPVFTRTMNLPQFVINNNQSTSTSTATPTDIVNDQHFQKTPRSGMRYWNKKSIFDKLPNVGSPIRMAMRFPHGRYMEQRRVAFGGNPPIPLRRPGPRFS